ncbi:MAG: FAD synthase [Candidatus Thalassarchaeaceae archaeon]|jgi:FAD synthetase|nr:FAD synthase [Euryarchaeota archaeon]MDP6220242.1 FAD synthase [Candidatus Thalassarchaeaceae archaeon]MBV43681.1 FAD synthase [Euryarchaeota archaeon]MDP7091940.1 FAD synthase [Candidatus Thalassarchaeaceae archaeon]MDP7257192.1 FAD synthase [Candidatus Thalassarchaeaceae archaeon]|tara:strand:- start:13695 stop:14153 length:459 start_codon:yes stop_codon:yes gene_type:complete
MVRVMAVGIFDLLHAGHLHYVERARSLGDELVVVVAHDDTVREQKHEPITGQELRRRMVEGLKPVDQAIVGNPPKVPIFEILETVKPDLIALGYDQKHSIESIHEGLSKHGYGHIEVLRVEGLSDDLDGTRKIISRILDLWPSDEGGPYEED